MTKIVATTKDAYKLFHDGTLALAHVEQNGMRVDVEYCMRKRKHLARKIQYFENKFKETKFAKQWQHTYKDRTNFDSNPQLAHYLYTVRKIKPLKLTETGQGAVDVEALEGLGIPALDTLISGRKLKKVKETYIEGFLREQVNGYVHTMFNLNTVTSYRSCVAKGTKILIGDRLTKHPTRATIENVKAGDKVYCYDDMLNLTKRTVLWSGQTGHKYVVRLHWKGYGGKTGYLDVTPEHGIRHISGIYIPAMNWEVDPALFKVEKRPQKLRVLSCSIFKDSIFGQLLRFPGNTIITKVEYLDEAVDVYDIEVEECHNFIANEICVHNSSSFINLQNIPKRDDELMQICRRAIIPRKGHQIVEIDFGTLEVKGAACVVGSTKIQTINGSKSIYEIIQKIKAGKNVHVYGYSLDKKRIGIGKVLEGGITQKKAEVWCVTLDNGKTVIATPDHKFLMRDGTYVELKDLPIGASLMPFYKKITKRKWGNYHQIWLNNGTKMLAHNLIAQDILGYRIAGTNKVIHHKNSNGCDNALSNLQVMTRRKHMSIHSKQGWKNKPIRKGAIPPEKQAILAAQHKEWYTNLPEWKREEFRVRLKESIERNGGHKGKKNSMYGRKHSEETKRKISAARKGKGCGRIGWSKGQTKETNASVAIIAAKAKGRKVSAETRKKLSSAGMGRKSWNKGKTYKQNLTPAQQAHYSETAKERWIQRKNAPKKVCPICGKEFIIISNTHIECAHNIPWNEYKEKYNHKVVKIEFYGYRDVYNITVEGLHNYATTAGVVLKNCYHKDKQMIHDVLEGDMHTDMAKEIFLLKHFNKDFPEHKVLRNATKNGFVFPQFYGDYYGNNAIHLAKKWGGLPDNKPWRNGMGIPMPNNTNLADHLIASGIDSYQAFEEHLKRIEDYFWNKRYKRYGKWREEWYDAYQKKGYFTNFTGFRFSGLMRKNQVINFPVQSCLQGHCKVFTDKGWLPIKELVGEQVKIWTGFNWADAVGLERGEWPLAKITLDSGLIINCDTNHKLKNENHEWVDFVDLKVGGRVALPIIPQVIKPTKEITWEFILGFILGDGCLVSRLMPNKTRARKLVRIVVGKKKKNDLIAILNYLTACGFKGYKPLKITIQYKKGYSAPLFQLTIEDKKFVTVLEQEGFVFGSTAHTKTIPDKIWTKSPRQQRDFLEGLFRSDGSRMIWHIGNLHMCNKNLLREVQVLAAPLGFDSYLVKTNTGWLLRFSHRGKNKKHQRRIPYATVRKLVHPKQITPSKKDNKTIVDRRVMLLEKDLTQYVGERIVKKYGNGEEIYRYDKIVSIELLEKKETTYTMSVNDPLHQFVADGVIHKNSAFHCLLWSLIELDNLFIKEKLDSRIISQIHDAILFDVPPDELDYVLRIAQEIMCKRLLEHWQWIIVPLTVDADVCAVDAPWSEKHGVKLPN